MGGVCRAHGDMRSWYKILVWKPKYKTTLSRYRLKWENNIKIDIREIVLEGVDWIHLAQYSTQWQVPVDMVMKFRVLPQKMRNFETG
jgi:hypothetical protein